MKLFNILSVTFLVIFTGCDNLFQDQSVPNPPEFEYLIEDLNSELSLDSEQRSTARNSLERGREFHPDPAALWDLAATLQQVLTPEQKDSLLSKLNNFDSKIISIHLGYMQEISFLSSIPAYDVDFQEFSPGKLMISNIMDYLMAIKCQLNMTIRKYLNEYLFI